MAKLTNLNLWNALRAKFPTFRSITAQGTGQLFTEKGFEQLQNVNPEALDQFFGLSLRVFLQRISVSQAKDTLADKGFGEYYDTPRGGLIQRMSVNTITPISPGWRNLQNGDSRDPFVVRKPDADERIFPQNYDYASLVTIPDEYAFKQIFIAEYGMNELMGGIMQAMENGYIAQTMLNKLEAIHAGIASTRFPLKDTQQMLVKYTTGTQVENKNLWLAIKNTIDAMQLGPQTDAFNAMGFMTTQNKEDLKLLIRPGYRNTMTAELLSVIYGADRLNFEIDIIEVPHFGGLRSVVKEAIPAQGGQPAVEKGLPATPVMDALGAVVKGSYRSVNGVILSESQVEWIDPHADVIGIIADKGYIFHSQQNPYRVEPIRNPRGLYTNYWASSPNNAINVDHLYNIVVIRRVDELPEATV